MIVPQANPIILPSVEGHQLEYLSLVGFILGAAAVILLGFTVASMFDSGVKHESTIVMYSVTAAVVILTIIATSFGVSNNEKVNAWYDETQSMIGDNVTTDQLKQANLHTRVLFKRVDPNLTLGGSNYLLDGRVLEFKEGQDFLSKEQMKQVRELYQNATPSQQRHIRATTETQDRK